MRLPLPRPFQTLKRFLPRSLLGRSLLIMLMPMIITQGVALQIFYGNNLAIISRRFAAALAGEISVTATQIERDSNPEDRAWILARTNEALELPMTFEPTAALPTPTRAPHRIFFGGLDQAMSERVHFPYVIDWKADPNAVLVSVELPDGVLKVKAPLKRVYGGTLYLFLIWIASSAIVLFAIASLFMRNQVRALRRLANAAEAFGIGRDIGPIKPEGAIEIRQAATAFNRMQERIRRYLGQRTEMLAGVSHDLRTPLTRLRLAVALLESHPDFSADAIDMEADIAEMDRMIEGYLAFVRGEGAEQARPTDLSSVLEDIISSAKRAGSDIELAPSEPIVIWLRPDSLRRALTNLVDNARRHATKIHLAAHQAGLRAVEIMVDDNGPGIPEAQREQVFRPFSSGADGNTGLGLTIARDIVRAHGGEITLEDSPFGGLRARVVLPI